MSALASVVSPRVTLMDSATALRERHLRRLMREKQLHTVFQPILDLQQGNFFACEALLRGPAGSALERPDQLFSTAASAGCSQELEWLAIETAILQFVELRSPLRLFLNMSIGCLNASREHLPSARRHLLRLGIPPSRIVIELTENQSVSDYSALRTVLDDFRKLGIQIAMDDMGEGFSNLRMWSEVKPDFVKIDRHFITGIDSDPIKFHFVRAMSELADACGGVLIAEGIETDAELNALRELGIPYLQGYRIARPQRTLPVPPVLPMKDGLTRGTPLARPRSMPRIEQLLHTVSSITPDTDNDAVYQIFECAPELPILPVVEHGVVLGIITRTALIDRFARPYRRELYGKRSCTLMMELPVLVDVAQTAQAVAQLVSNQRGSKISDCFVITREGRYAGIGYTRELMALITDLQIRAARYANPLTQLPGNVPINEHLDRLLDGRTSFVAAYCDLDHFKPYNDEYGYRRGDLIIQELGNILTASVDEQVDFVGHVGGDDFIVLLQSTNWEVRLHGVITDFLANLPPHVSPDHLAAGGYAGEDRRGSPVFHPLPGLSIGCVMIEPGQFRDHYEVSAALSEAKKEAKRILGSTLFIERRRPPAPENTAATTGAVPSAPTFGPMAAAPG
jgi:EAL domain-containing protein (putative c-di-GMP-specific phosphodiesterase class I)/GGDEF domain-containing protein